MKRRMKMKKIAITFMSLILLLTLANFNFISAHETMSKEEVYTMIKEVNINDNNEIEIILNLNEDGNTGSLPRQYIRD